MQPKIKQLTSLQNDVMRLDQIIGKLGIKDPEQKKLMTDALKEVNKTIITLYSSTLSPEELSDAYKNIFSQLAVLSEQFFELSSPEQRRKLMDQINAMSEKTLLLETQHHKSEKTGLLNMVLGELKSQGVTTMAPSVIQAVNLAVDAAVAKSGGDKNAAQVGDLAKNTAAGVLTTLANNPSKQGLISALVGGAVKVAGGVAEHGVKAAAQEASSKRRSP